MVRNADAALLTHLWRTSEGPSLAGKVLDVLNCCASVFSYKGKAAIREAAMTMPLGSAGAKRLLEQQCVPCAPLRCGVVPPAPSSASSLALRKSLSCTSSLVVVLTVRATSRGMHL